MKYSIHSDNVRQSSFWYTDQDGILLFDKTVKECREMLIEIVDEYKDLLEELRDA
jgi:hypothetical protein